MMSELASYFCKKENLAVHLIVYGKNRETFYELPDSVHIHQPSWFFNDSKRITSTIKTLLFLRNEIKNINPDVVLSFGEYWNSFVMISLLGYKVPIYISDRCSPDKILKQPHELLRRLLYPRASRIIAQTSKAENEYVKRRYNKNIRTIGNPVRSIKSKKDSINKENIVLTVGRLISTKHHDRLIKIFKEVNPGDWKLVIVGGDALKEEGRTNLEELVKRSGIQNQVEFTGVVADVDAYFMKSKIFAFTSSSEGFPNVIGEAMSAGLPVVAYDCVAGPSDMVKDGLNGHLVKVFDDKSFKQKLKLLMGNESLRKKMGAASKELIQAYSAPSVSDKFYQFITETK